MFLDQYIPLLDTKINPNPEIFFQIQYMFLHAHDEYSRNIYIEIADPRDVRIPHHSYEVAHAEGSTYQAVEILL
jgi:hypothetical protein